MSPGTMARNRRLFAQPFTVDEDALGNEAAYRAQLELCLHHDSTAMLSRIRCPTLVVSAEEDLLTTAAQGRALADGIAGARCVEIAEASHGLIWERPRELGETLARFLEEESGEWP